MRNVAIATEDVAMILDLVTERGFNASAIKMKMAKVSEYYAKGAGSESEKSSNSGKSKSLSSNSTKKGNRYEMELPLSVIPERR